MRLDHLLSKENCVMKHLHEIPMVNVLISLFNFEGSFKKRRREDLKYGGVAQLGEHLPCKQGVMGSNPIISIPIRED